MISDTRWRAAPTTDRNDWTRRLTQEVQFVTEPIVDLQTEAVVAREVLARPRNGMRFPSWVGGLAPALVEAVWWCALECATPLLDAGLTTHVNIGARQLARPDLVHMLGDRLDARHLAHLVVEVTEHEPLEPSPSLEANVGWLRERGAAIALDDFGEGFANFASFSTLVPETVKVSKEVVRPPAGDDRAEWFVAACRAIGAQRTVVERIESADDRAWAARAGFDAGQGFLWS